MERLINWLDLSSGRSPENPRLTYHYHIVFMLLCACGSFLLLCYGATELLALQKNGSKIWIMALLLTGISFYIPGIQPLPVISAFALILLSGVIASYCLSLCGGAVMAGSILWSAYEVKRPGFTGRIFKKTAAFFKFRRAARTPLNQVVLLVMLALIAIAAWVAVFGAGLAFIVKTFLLTMIRYVFLPFILWHFLLSRLCCRKTGTFKKDIREKQVL